MPMSLEECVKLAMYGAPTCPMIAERETTVHKRKQMLKSARTELARHGCAVRISDRLHEWGCHREVDMWNFCVLATTAL